MNGKYLIINGGSSSLKFSLYEMPNKIEIINGTFEKIGKQDSFFRYKINGNKIKKEIFIPNHETAINIMFKELLANRILNSINDIKGVGHRILHGGEFYSDSVEITDEVITNVESLIRFAPLHIPSELNCIKYIKEIMPNIPQIGVFDTAFHQTMPEYNYIYGIPYEYYEKYGIRKYGAHGISHKYITETMKKMSRREDINIISCHIGSGASICSVKNGKSFDTSMGVTPLEGLVMGTRSGSIDPAIVEFISELKKISVNETLKILNTESGLKGIAGENDIRDLTVMAKNGDKRATLAIQIFVNSITKCISSYFPGLNGKVNAIVLTAGVGENSKEIREMILNNLSISYDIQIDINENNQISSSDKKQSGVITTNKSKIPVFVIPTDEESIILEDTYNITNRKEKVKKLTTN